MSYATETLVYYIKTLWEGSGLTFDSDNYAEVECTVESLVDEASDKARRTAAKQILDDERANFRKITASLTMQALVSRDDDPLMAVLIALNPPELDNPHWIAECKAKAAVLYADALAKELGL